MNAVVYNNQMKIPITVEALLLHCSYLLAGTTIAAGDTRQLFYHHARKYESFAEKLSYLEGLFKNHEGFEGVRSRIKAYKDFKKIKHPPAHLIVAHKRLQKSLEAEYENQMGSFPKDLANLRLIGIDALAPHGYFDWYHTNDPRWLMPGEKHASAAEMAALFPEQNREATLFLLPLSLFSEGQEFGEAFAHDAPLPPALKQFSFLHTTFQLPSLNLLSLDEIHAVKMQLQEPAKRFHGAVARWVQVCRQPQADGHSLRFFKEDVLPAAEDFQTAMKENFMLNQHVQAGNDKRGTSFALGELSPVAIWGVFRDQGLLSDEDWSSLQAKREDPAYNRPMPVMVLDGFLEEAFDEPDTEKVFLKKALNIDE